MDKPTDEQIKEFWEWCGFRKVEPKYCHSCKRKEPPYWLKEGIGRRLEEPTLDLNNLFKYAMPILFEKTGWSKGKSLLQHWAGYLDIYDPALALFWTIWEVIHG